MDNSDTRFAKARQEVLPYFRRLTGDPWLAEDVVQDACASAWESFKEKDAASLKRLLMAIGRNRYFNCRKKDGCRKRHLTALCRTSPAFYLPTEGECTADQQEVAKAWTRLPKIHQEVLFRAFFLGQRNREIASSLGQTVTNVKNLRRRGLQRLRACFLSVGSVT